MTPRVLVLKPQVDSKNRNIVRDFVYGCWCNGRRVGGMQMPPLNELYATTHARQPGLTVEFLDAQIQPERYRRLLESNLDDLLAVVIMSSTQSFRRDVATLGEFKASNPGIKGILFGSHPTFMASFCLREPEVDFVIQKEAEETLRQLLGALLRGEPLAAIPGLGYRETDGGIRVNPHRAFLDMDALPIPDRSLLPPGVDYFNPAVKRLPYTTMITSRGCPGQCTFCTAPFFYGNKARVRSADNVLNELREVIRLGYKEVFFRDETFTAYKARNRKICEGMIREKMDLTWIANGRVDMIDRETMVLMKEAGCHMLKFGVETGSDAILRNYAKGTTCDQARQVFRMAHETGLDTHAHVMFGGPGESAATIDETIRFTKELDPTTVSFGIITPYPGTPLFERVAAVHPEIKDGSDSNMENLHVSGFYSEALCGLDSAYLSRRVVGAYRAFYLRPSYLFKRLRGIRSLEELMILTVAGLNIFQYTLSGEK